MFKRSETNTFSYKHLLNNLKKKDHFADIADEISILFESVSLLLTGALPSNSLFVTYEVAKSTKILEILGKLLKRIVAAKNDSLSVSERMDAAYATICYSAFFDTLSAELPPWIIKGIDLQKSEKKFIANYACQFSSNDANDVLVRPDIAYELEEAKDNLKDLYNGMLQKLRRLLESLSYVEKENTVIRQSLDSAFKNFTNDAIAEFEKQYLDLCTEIPQFYSYISMRIITKFASDLGRDSNRFEKLISARKEDISAGFQDLKDCLSTVDQQIDDKRAHDAANNIIEKAKHDIKKPIFGSKQKDGGLIFPSIEDAFIPQSYKALIYSGEEHLESNNEWKNRPDEYNQAAFWAKYFNDPKSEENLLLILGEPGIGKSLVTKIIAAQMGSLSQIIVQISLRNTDVEKDVDRIIIDQINEDGDVTRRFETLKAFTGFFPNQPITVFFDGYDELQQATGRVYHEFLNKLSSFQRICKEDKKRPLRIVVTSRSTLIDKTYIPHGTVVLQLNEFDQNQKKKWIDIWNKTNKSSFEEYHLKEFILPNESSEINKLSGQPLLLLMLAIYDADFENRQNALGQNKEIDRTQLYNELIRRFIRRELTKGSRGNELNYSEMDEKEKDDYEESELRRLGVVALGMFARGKLSITAKELKTDFSRLNEELRQYSNYGKKMLKSEEAFFGSFFFIHDPRPTSKENEEYQEASFEFLHKTFYEFLVNDIVLQCAYKSIMSLCKLKKDPDEDGIVRYREELESILIKSRNIYLVLSGACLCTEPVIIQMMKEWCKIRFWTKLATRYSDDTIATVLRELISKHAEMIKTGGFSIPGASVGSLIDGRTVPQSSSIYLLNLFTLSAILCSSFTLNSELWDYAAHYIRLNLRNNEQIKRGKQEKKNLKIDVSYTDEILLRFISFFTIIRNNSSCTISLRPYPVKLEELDLLAARMELYDFLCEDEQKKLYSLHRSDIIYHSKKLAIRNLVQKGMNMNSEQFIDSLCSSQAKVKYDYNLRDISAILDSLTKCRDVAFVQKGINSLLSYSEAIVLHGHITSSAYGLESVFSSISSIIEFFPQDKGIIIAALKLANNFSRMIEFGTYNDSSRHGDNSGYRYHRLWPTSEFTQLFNRLKDAGFFFFSPFEFDEYINLDIIKNDQLPYATYDINDCIKCLDNYKYAFGRREYALGEYIEAMRIAKYKGDHDLFKNLVGHMRLDRLLESETICVRDLFKLLILFKNTDFDFEDTLKNLFIDRFPDCYTADPKASVYAFCELASSYHWSQKDCLRNSEASKIYNIGRYIIRNYNTILEQFFSEAILALIVCIKVLRKNQNFYMPIRKSFNMFIYNPSNEYVDRIMSLIGVFNYLDSTCIDLLSRYFAKNLSSLQIANNEIADAISRFFKF